MNLAKQSTAKTFIVGPILDSAGAAKTDEVVGSIKVTKNGTVGAANGSTTLTHDHTGHYKLACASGDLDTLGEVEFTLNSGTNAMAPVKFQVVPAMVYDSLVAGSDTLQADLVQVDGTANASATLSLKKITISNSTGNAVEFLSTGSNGHGFRVVGHGTGNGVNVAAGATGRGMQINGGSTSGMGVYIVTTAGDGINVEVQGASNNGISLSVNDGLAISAVVPGDVFSANVVTEIQDGLATAANLATVAGYIDTEVAGIISTLGTPAGASVSDDIAAVKSQTAAIEADTQDLQTQVGSDGAGLTNLPWNAAWDAEVQSEVQDAIEANHLDHLLAAAYDPANKPGHADGLLNKLVENDAGVPRFTDNSLERAPSGGSAPTANQVADAVLTRAASNWEASADPLSLGGMVLANLNGVRTNTDLIAYKSDGTTPFYTYTIIVAATMKPVKSLKA
jgi:hypothetical protein